MNLWEKLYYLFQSTEKINENVYLTLRNKISEHFTTIAEQVIEKIGGKWQEFNITQQRILSYLFLNYEGTLGDLTAYTSINQNIVRTYLNQFIEQGIVCRNSDKLRDNNGKYTFKKA